MVTEAIRGEVTTESNSGQLRICQEQFQCGAHLAARDNSSKTFFRCSQGGLLIRLHWRLNWSLHIGSTKRRTQLSEGIKSLKPSRVMSAYGSRTSASCASSPSTCSPRAPVERPPFCHVDSSEEVREVRRQYFQNVFHAGPDLWNVWAPEPLRVTRHWKTSCGLAGRTGEAGHHFSAEAARCWLDPSVVGVCARSLSLPSQAASIVLRRFVEKRGCHVGGWLPKGARRRCGVCFHCSLFIHVQRSESQKRSESNDDHVWLYLS